MIFSTLLAQVLKAKRTLWITYSAIGLGFLLLYLAVYPSIQSQSANYDKIYASLPKGLMSALNITNSTPDLMGYLSSKHFGFIWLLIMALLVIAYSAFVIAKEIENKTMGFLLSQPISRLKLYVARYVGGIIGLGVSIGFSEVIVWPLAKLFNYAIDGPGVLWLGLAGLLFGLSIMSLGFMFSAMSSSSARVSALTGAVLLVMYAAFIASSLVSNLDGLKYLSLFHYITPGDIVANSSIPLASVLVFGIFSLATTIIGAVIFKRRQIQV